MKNKLASKILFFCMCFGFLTSIFGQSNLDKLNDETENKQLEKTKAVLSSIYKLSVNVEIELSNEFKERHRLEGLNEKLIKLDVELQLKKAGFELNDSNTLFKIEINDWHTGELNVWTELSDKFLLERNSYISYDAVVWINDISIDSNRVETNSIKSAVSDSIDAFVRVCSKARKLLNRPPINGSQSKQTDLKNSQVVPKNNDSPFAATYIGGNGPPEVEIFNDSDRTMYIDLGQGKLTAYTILSKQSISLKLVNGNYNYKASAARVSPLQGINEFRTGYRYTWRFTILKR